MDSATRQAMIDQAQFMVIAEISFLVAVVVITVIYSYFKNRKFMAENPGKKRYMWGFYQGAAPLVVCILLSILMIAVGENPFNLQGDEQLGAIYFIVMGSIGYFVIKRNRWAFVIQTIISMNPIMWIINSIYIYRRWSEMKAPEKVVVELLPDDYKEVIQI